MDVCNTSFCYCLGMCLSFWSIIRKLTDVIFNGLHEVCCFWRDGTRWARASSFTRFLDHTQRRTTVGRTLGKLSAHHRDLNLISYNTHKRVTSMPPVRFELTVSAGERPQTYAFDRAATGTSS